jgi:hypothetical protein
LEERTVNNAWNKIKKTLEWACRLIAVGLVLWLLFGWYTGREAERDNTLKNLNTQITDRDATIARLNNTLQTKDERLATVERQVAVLTNLGSTEGQLRQTILDKEAAMRGLRSDLVSTTAEVDSATRTIAGLNTRNREVLARIDDFRAQLASQEQRVRGIQTEKGALVAQIAQLHAFEVEHLELNCKAQIASLNSSVLTLEQDRTRLQLQVARLSSCQPTPSTNPVDVGVYTYGVRDGFTFRIRYWPTELTNGPDEDGFPLPPPASNTEWPKQTPSFQSANMNTGRNCFTINQVPAGDYTFEISEQRRGTWTRVRASHFIVVPGRNVNTLTPANGQALELSTNNGQLILLGRDWTITEGSIASRSK